VDGDELDRESLGSGPFAIAMPVASSDDDRTIELRWADTTHPSSSDDREVAARLAFVGLVAGNAPSAVASNLRALSDPHLRFRGVHPDGWLEQSATLELRQAHHTELVVKARTLPGVESRSLEIRLDGEIVQRVETDARFVTARVSVAPTTHDTRRVDLRWSSADPLSSSDSRRVAAHLAFVGFVTPRPPAVIDRSTDPADPQLETDGLHEDFWLAETSQLTLAGGPPCDLLLRAELDRARTQTVDVLVNGVVVGSADARGTSVELRTPLPASDDKRIVELRWSNAFNVTTADPRAVSARLVQLGLEAQRTSLARRLVPHRR
jgi:hypothetical protein